MTNNIKRYGEAFRRQVVKEYEAGCSVSELRKKYGITGGQTVQGWIKKYASAGLRQQVMRIQTAEEANQVKVLEQKVAELERALARTTLEKLKAESTLEEYQQHYGTELAEKNAVPSSPVSSKNAGKEGSG